MENEDKNIGLISNENIEIENVFKPNYENQNLDNNIEYQKWKESMIKKYGTKGKLYKCPKDKILFYTSDDDGGHFHENEGLCPLCKEHICYFCSNYLRSLYKCCFKKKFSEMYRSGIELSGTAIKDYNDYEDRAIKYFLLPGVNLIFFIGIVFNFSYYKLVMGYEDYHAYAYESFLHQNYFRFSIILAINGITAIFLALSFFLYCIYISIFLLILLIFYKRGFSFFIGLSSEDFRYLNKNFHKVFNING